MCHYSSVFTHCHKRADVFAGAISKCIFYTEMLYGFCKKKSVNFLIVHKSTSVQIMAWRRKDVKPLPEPMITSVFGHHMASAGHNESTGASFSLILTTTRILGPGCTVLQWRHMCVMASQIHRPLDCLLSSFTRLTSKKTLNLHITWLLSPLRREESTGKRRFRSQRASDAENVSMSWHTPLGVKLRRVFTLQRYLK